MHEFDLDSPRTLDEACQALAETGGRLLAGGTDLIPRLTGGRLRAACLVDLSRLTDLRFIDRAGSQIRVGALTTFAEIAGSALLQSAAPVLAQAAAALGSLQTRHRATLGGNIGNASPAGDSLPPLLVLDATVTLVSRRGEREASLAAFLLGPGRTGAAPDEIIHHVSFTPLDARMGSLFVKLGSREGMAISVASVATALRLDEEGRVEDVRIALGAVAPTAVRCPEAEGLLGEQLLTQEAVEAAAESAGRACSPIDDVRASGAYRRHAVKVLVRRSLLSLSQGAA